MEDSNHPEWHYEVIYEHPLRTVNAHLASNDRIRTDAPKDNHGLGEAFSPTDLLSTSLASCALTIMGIHAQTKDYEIKAMTANVRKTMAAHPRRVAAIHIAFHVTVNGSISDREWMMLERAGRQCPVAKSLHPEIDQQLSFYLERT